MSSRIALVPTEQARDLLGPPPAGVTVGVWAPDDPAPPEAADAGFWVPQFLSPDALDRQLSGLPALQVVQLLTAGADAFVGRLPDGVTVCDATVRRRRITPETGGTGADGGRRRRP